MTETSANPLDQDKVKDDPSARKIMAEAFEQTYRWPIDFKGFKADLSIREMGRFEKGTARIDSGRDVTICLESKDLQEWAEGQIGMMAVHRSHRTFEESDGRSILSFGEEDGHPSGVKLIISGGGTPSYYRVRDNRIFQINRRMERMKFTINVEDSLRTSNNKNLTTRYSVYYFSPRDNSLTKVETYSDIHVQVERIYLPGSRTTSFSENGEVVTRVIQFENHQLL